MHLNTLWHSRVNIVGGFSVVAGSKSETVGTLPFLELSPAQQNEVQFNEYNFNENLIIDLSSYLEFRLTTSAPVST